MPDDLAARRLPGFGDRLSVLGCGEAFDESRSNTSLVLRSQDTTLLLDCGFTAPPAAWSELGTGESFQGIWISHLHADHAMGLPALLTRMWEDRRSEPLTLLGQHGIRDRVLELVEAGYPGMTGRFGFPVAEVAVEPGTGVAWRDLELRSAETNHGLRNLAVRITTAAGGVMAYSGDGQPSSASAALGREAHWIHECFSDREAVPGHANLSALLDLLPEVAPNRLGLVHVSRRFRREVASRVDGLAGRRPPVELLGRGTCWTL